MIINIDSSYQLRVNQCYELRKRLKTKGLTYFKIIGFYEDLGQALDAYVDLTLDRGASDEEKTKYFKKFGEMTARVVRQIKEAE